MAQRWRTILITASGTFMLAALQPADAAPSWWTRWRAPANTAPSISGTPATSVQAGKSYSFKPAASDAQNNKLTFSISNKPAWATFSATSGSLSGTPAASNVGSYGNIVIRVSDGSLSTALPAFAIAVTGAANTAPVISGTPSASVVAGADYSFAPTASDADGNPLGFSVSNKPSWATFNTSTGALTGKPTAQQAGTYGNIVISVSDGVVSRSLTAFSITVTQPAAQGLARLMWSAPTRNTDGSTLTDLSGYWVFHGTSANALNEAVQLAGNSNTTYTFTSLSSGTHYFAVAAYNSTGSQSERSAVLSKTIP